MLVRPLLCSCQDQMRDIRFDHRTSIKLLSGMTFNRVRSSTRIDYRSQVLALKLLEMSSRFMGLMECYAVSEIGVGSAALGCQWNNE